MLQTIKNFFINLGNMFHLQAFESFLESAFVSIRPMVIAELKDIAMAAVQVAEAAFTAPGSGKEKFAQAVATIAADAKTIAINATPNEINVVTELAVGVLNGQQAAGTVSAAAPVAAAEPVVAAPVTETAAPTA